MKKVRLDAGLSYDPDGRIVRYRWYAAEPPLARSGGAR